MRVHELARKLKITSKELIAELKKHGVKAGSHMELLDAKVADAMSKKLASLKTSATEKGPAHRATLKTAEKKTALKKEKAPSKRLKQPRAAEKVKEPEKPKVKVVGKV